MRIPYVIGAIRVVWVFVESRSLELERKLDGNFHLKLNRISRPIANKYREGKVKRTLKRGLKVSEIVKVEANETSKKHEIVVLPH